MTEIEMDSKKIRLDEAHPSERNVRRHPEEQIQELVRNLKKYGQYRPLVLAADGEILVGNGLYLAMRSLGWEEADARILPEDASESQKLALMLADNRLYEIGGTDREAVEKMLKDMMEESGEIDVPGFTDEQIEDMLEPIDIDSLFREMTPEEKEKAEKRRMVTCPECGAEFEP